MEVTIVRKVKLSMGEQKKYQGDNRVAKRNRKFYNSGVKIKTTTSGSAGTESDGGIRSEKDRRQEGECETRKGGSCLYRKQQAISEVGIKDRKQEGEKDDCDCLHRRQRWHAF